MLTTYFLISICFERYGEQEVETYHNLNDILVSIYKNNFEDMDTYNLVYTVKDPHVIELRDLDIFQFIIVKNTFISESDVKAIESYEKISITKS